MERLIDEARRLMPDVGIQVPPNLSDWWPQLVRAGATDLGGLSANGDHISPEHPFPSPAQVRKRLAEDGVALSERPMRVPRVHRPRVDLRAGARRDQEPLLVIHPPARERTPSGGAGRDRRRAARRPARARRARAHPGGTDRAVRRAASRGDRGDAIGRRRAPSPTGRRRRHVRRQSQHQRLQHLRGGLRVLRLRPVEALPRRL